MKRFFKYLFLIIIIALILYILAYFLSRSISDRDRNQENEIHASKTFQTVSEKYTLQFSTYEEAVNYFKKVSHVYVLRNPDIFIDNGNVPYLRARTEQAIRRNICTEGYLNLLTKEWRTRDDVCVIYD